MKLAHLAGLLVLPVFWLQQPDNSTAPGSPQADNSLAPAPIIRRPARAIAESAVIRVDPVYPPLAKAAWVHGPVLVEMEIDENGTVTSARAISGHPLLKSAAETAAAKWKFKPATLNNTPARVEGLILFKFQATDSEIDVLKTKIAAEPFNDRCYEELGAAYVSQERYDEAVNLYEQAIKIGVENDSLHYHLAQVFFETRRYQEAAEEYRLSAELWPLLSVAWEGLARAEEKLGHYELAIQAYKDSIDASEDPEVLYELGKLYNKLGRHQEALEILEKAAEYTETWEDLHFELGVTYVKTGRIEDAEQEYQRLRSEESPLAGDLFKLIHERER